jgi:hypothetical protein
MFWRLELDGQLGRWLHSGSNAFTPSAAAEMRRRFGAADSTLPAPGQVQFVPSLYPPALPIRDTVLQARSAARTPCACARATERRHAALVTPSPHRTSARCLRAVVAPRAPWRCAAWRTRARPGTATATRWAALPLPRWRPARCWANTRTSRDARPSLLALRSGVRTLAFSISGVVITELESELESGIKSHYEFELPGFRRGRGKTHAKHALILEGGPRCGGGAPANAMPCACACLNHSGDGSANAHFAVVLCGGCAQLGDCAHFHVFMFIGVSGAALGAPLLINYGRNFETFSRSAGGRAYAASEESEEEDADEERSADEDAAEEAEQAAGAGAADEFSQRAEEAPRVAPRHASQMPPPGRASARAAILPAPEVHSPFWARWYASQQGQRGDGDGHGVDEQGGSQAAPGSRRAGALGRAAAAQPRAARCACACGCVHVCTHAARKGWKRKESQLAPNEPAHGALLCNKCHSQWLCLRRGKASTGCTMPRCQRPGPRFGLDCDLCTAAAEGVEDDAEEEGAAGAQQLGDSSPEAQQQLASARKRPAEEEAREQPRSRARALLAAQSDGADGAADAAAPAHPALRAALQAAQARLAATQVRVQRYEDLAAALDDSGDGATAAMRAERQALGQLRAAAAASLQEVNAHMDDVRAAAARLQAAAAADATQIERSTAAVEAAKRVAEEAARAADVARVEVQQRTATQAELAAAHAAAARFWPDAAQTLPDAQAE